MSRWNDRATDAWREAFDRVQASLRAAKGQNYTLVAGMTFAERNRIAAELKNGVDREKVIAEAARRIIDGDESGKQ